MSGTLPTRRLESCSAFPAYRSELLAWLDGSAVDETALSRIGAELANQLRAAGFFPEHVLMELHALGFKPDGDGLTTEESAALDRRYMRAIGLLLRFCYGEPPPLRSVRDADGRDWIVMLVREGMRWDPEIEMRRRDWLSCVAPDDRRYLTPVPRTWEQWTDDELMTRILHAPVDLRGPK